MQSIRKDHRMGIVYRCSFCTAGSPLLIALVLMLLRRQAYIWQKLLEVSIIRRTISHMNRTAHSITQNMEEVLVFESTFLFCSWGIMRRLQVVVSFPPHPRKTPRYAAERISSPGWWMIQVRMIQSGRSPGPPFLEYEYAKTQAGDGLCC